MGDNKSVYSLVLMDEVVQRIDDAAHLLGSSRSSLINQILADYLSYTTPEKRMKTVFDQMLELMAGSQVFQIQPHPSDAMLSVRSSLRYRYKPTIRYSVELYPTGSVAGELRVSCRTQSQPLLAAIDCFARLWMEVERPVVTALFPGQLPYRLEEGRFTRQFLWPSEQGHQSPEDLAAALTAYIQCMDRAMKCHFENLDNPQAALAGVHGIYLEYQNSFAPVI